MLGDLVVVVLVDVTTLEWARLGCRVVALVALGVAAAGRQGAVGGPQVSVHVAVCGEGHLTVLALEGSLARVHQHVAVKGARRAEDFVANAAAELVLAAAVGATGRVVVAAQVIRQLSRTVQHQWTGRTGMFCWVCLYKLRKIKC